MAKSNRNLRIGDYDDRTRYRLVDTPYGRLVSIALADLGGETDRPTLPYGPTDAPAEVETEIQQSEIVEIFRESSTDLLAPTLILGDRLP